MKLVAILVAATVLGGCANQNSIFRTNQVSSSRPTVITVDAKQRHLLTVPGRDGQMRVCAEASPDVFSALSTSAGADLGFGQSGGQTDARAQAAIAIAEAAGTIERTQTINMLRESMYRTCERYLSGAIDRATFVVQAGRDWRAMIAILAIEQLTRMARPPSTIISAGGTSANIENAGDVLQRVAAAEDAQRVAQADVERAQTTQSANCAGTPPTAACTAATQGVTNAQARLTTANNNLASWQRIAQNPPRPDRTQSSTQAGPDDPGGLTVQPTAPSDEVARIVGGIVRDAFDTDETQLFCLQILSTDNQLQRTDQEITERGESVEQLCMQYLAARVQNDIERLRTWQVTRAGVQRQTTRRQAVENYLNRGPGTPAERWNALVAPIAHRFEFDPISVSPNATVGEILGRLDRLGSAADELVERINQGGS